MSTRGLAPAEITTARLRLRPPSSRDAQSVFAYASDPVATRYMSWSRHRSEQDSRGFLTHCDDEWRSLGTGTYLIVETSSGQIIGSTGLHMIAAHRACTGYILDRRWWGHGLATEAASAMIGLARTLQIIRVEAMCALDHDASARVLEKLGMEFEGIHRAYIVLPNLSPDPVDVRSYARILR
jgi:[ribosomal protein S5]-alanine N-acetyltransferase